MSSESTPVRLSGQRCFLHSEREAAVRCPGCGRFYCRECVTEHQNRMMCAHCVRNQGVRGQGVRNRGLRRQQGIASDETRAPGPRWYAFAVAGLLFAWLVFYYFGMALARMPSIFHGGLS